MRFAILVPLLALSGCVVPEDPAGTSHGLPSLAAVQDNPRLALMDHVLAEYFASDISSRPTVCASATADGTQTALAPDDESALMARYNLLAPLARCAWTDAGWQDARTDQPAIVFNLHEFDCATDAQCSGFASYTSGQAASMSTKYTMRFDGIRWRFESDPRVLMEER